MSKPVILLVDDEVDLLQLMETALGRAFAAYDVRGATTYDEAEGLVRTLRAADGTLSLLIVDHVLGGRTGLEFIGVVRDAFPDVPALMVTGQAPHQVEADAHAAGARVLWKPMRLRVLLDEVRTELGET